MKLEGLQKKFSNYRDKKNPSGNSKARFKYPVKLRSAAQKYFREHPDLSVNDFAELFGLSNSISKRWCQSEKKKKTPPAEADSGTFIDVASAAAVNLGNFPGIKIKCIEIAIPSGTSVTDLSLLLRGILTETSQ